MTLPPKRSSILPASIEVRGLTIRYGDRQALHDVDVDFPPGVISAVMGPSGCGKSSLLAALNRLTDLIPHCRVEGTVRVGGLDTRSMEVLSLRRRVGMIFQRPAPFPLSIRRNLTFPLKEHGVRRRSDREIRMEEALRSVGLWAEVNDRLDAPALGLSGGQQQRLCLARTLALEPEVLLLDEPCSALDPLAAAVVEDLILSLRGTYTIVIVTHNLAQARRLADHAALLWVRDGRGELVEAGPASALFSNPRHPLTADYLSGVRG